jgi:cyanophycin synthetase
MGHVIEHIALEIQTLAGMDTGFGERRTGTIQLFSYTEEERCPFLPQNQPLRPRTLIAGTEYDLKAIYKKMREIRERVR